MSGEELIKLYKELYQYVRSLDTYEEVLEKVVWIVLSDIVHTLDLNYDISIYVEENTNKVIVKDTQCQKTIRKNKLK